MAVKTEVYRVKGGAAEIIELPDGDWAKALGTAGAVRPSGDSVITLPAPKLSRIFSARRIALYPDGSPTAWPLGRVVVTEPEAFRDVDLVRLYGPYLSGLGQRAFESGLNAKMKGKEILVLVLAGLGALISLVTLAIVIVGFQRAGVL